MGNEVSKKHPPKRHDSSCVAVNITLQALLFISLLPWSPSVPISANRPLENSVKPSPNASSHSQLFIVVLILLVMLRDLPNLPVLFFSV